ncbi:MAG: co-chaperone GroES [Planctomycetales bacterium]|nr:co-chaperone GroES [Planctomycetales bacterium]
MALNVKPLDDRILVKPLEAEEKTAGGIVIPDTAKEKPQLGVVQAVGPGALLKDGKRGPMSVGKGDRVYFGKYAGADIKLEGDDFKILRESDVLAKEA